MRRPVLFSSLVGAALLCWWLADTEDLTARPMTPAPSPKVRQEDDRRSLARLVAMARRGAVDETDSATVVLRGAWGAEPGQFGRRPADESNPEAPMALAADSQGNLTVLDQVNRRLQRFDANGRLLGTIPIASETTQDLLLGEDRTYLLDRLGDTPGVEILDRAGRSLGRVPVPGPVREGGAITGLFADANGLYVENEHDDLVRAANAAGDLVGEGETIPGRPSRDGRLFLKAGIVHRADGRVFVQAHHRDKKLAWEAPLSLGRPLLHILLLDSDLSGNVYLGAEVGLEDPQTHEHHDLATLVVRLSPQGRLDGVLSLPPTTADAAETFRPLCVGDDGTVYQMLATDAGLQVTAHRF